jgi:hypothetical protein
MAIFMINFASSVEVWNDTKSLNLISYYKAGEVVGDVVDSYSTNNGIANPSLLRGVGGKNGFGYKFMNLSTSTVNFSTDWGYGASHSISMWVNVSGTERGIFMRVGGEQGKGFGLGVTDTGTLYGTCYGINDQNTGVQLKTGWVHVGVITNSSGKNQYFINGTSVAEFSLEAACNTPTIHTAQFGSSLTNDGGTIAYRFLNGSMDEIAIWERALTWTEMRDLYNEGAGLFFGGTTQSLVVNLTYPSNNSLHSDTNITFNATYTFSDMNIDNATYYFWNANNSIFNKTKINIDDALNYSTIILFNMSLGSVYHWNVHGCGHNTTDTICAWGNAGNYTFTSSAFTEGTRMSNNSVLETSRQLLQLEINGNPAISSASGYLWYNGTRYSSSVTDGTSGIYTATNLIDIPLNDYLANKTYIWEFIFVLSGGSIVRQNTSVFQQEVNKTYLNYCNATYTLQFINFTSRNAVNPFPKMNATFKMALNHWLGGGTTRRNYSYEDVSETMKNWTFCGSNNDSTYQVDASIEYDASGYAQNYYYLSNASLTNVTNAINIYLLNDSLATVTVLKVLDGAQNPKSGITISIQLYDVGTDTYYTVGMAKTSSDGTDIAYLNWYSSWYKFILTKEGDVLKIEEPSKISATPKIFTLQDTITFTFDKFRNFVYSLTFNNVTNNFILTFTKPSGLVDHGCLRVTKKTSYNDTQVCLVCESSASATVYCNINSYGNGTYIAKFYATGSLFDLETLVVTIGSNFAEEIYNLLGNDDATAYAFLFSGIVVSMFFISPVIAIIGVLLGMLGGAALGFTILNFSEFLGIVIIGGGIIWLLKR